MTAMDAEQAPLSGRKPGRDWLLPARRFAGRFKPSARPAVSDEQHNERVFYWEMFFQAIASAGAFSFTSVFLVRLGAPNWLVGMLSSLPALVIILTVLPTGAWVQRQRDLVKVSNYGRLIYRLVIATFGFLVYLPAGLAPFVMVVAEAVIAIPSAALDVAHSTVLGIAVSARRRPAMLSTRMAVHGITAAIVGYFAGQWLDRAPFPLNYQVLFLSALVAGLGSIAAFARIRLGSAPAETRERPRLSIPQILALVNATPAFKRYAIASFVFRMGLSLPMALFAIYRVRTLGASDAWIGILFTVERAVSVVMYMLLSRVLSQSRIRDRLWISCVMVFLYPLAMALAQTPEQLLLSSLVSGLFAPGMEIFITNTLFQVAPERNRPAFVAANSFLANLAAFGAPMLGTLFADLAGIRTALLIAAAVRVVGGLAFWRMGVGREERAPGPAPTS
jgi:hypothetical protein